MTDMVERVARAIWNADGWERAPADVRQEYLDLARAAIAAMRGPTEEMVHVGHLSMDRDGWDGPTTCWNWMIDAALGKKD